MLRLCLAFASALALVAAATRAVVVQPRGTAAACTLPDMRPPAAQRTFVSAAVDNAITTLVPRFKDPNLATLFANTLPNALDTTVYQHTGPNDTFIVTGDIPAMWLRDSTNQVLPYLRWVAQDAALRDLVLGLIARQSRSILIDPYANAFQVDGLHGQGPHTDDSSSRTIYAGTRVSAYTPDIFERKWEVDSLANHLRLSVEYFNATGDAAPFSDSTWLASVQLILATFTEQQRDTRAEDAAGGPAYTFQRQATEPTDTLQQGRGAPSRATGMIKSAFRGSDDACTFPFNIPENAFAAVQLRRTAELLATVGQPALAAQAQQLADAVTAGIAAWGTMQHPVLQSRVYAYEVDGFGNVLFMDDANVPGLISMPSYGWASVDDPLYAATRAGVLSNANPFFFNGSAASGIGGPHNGPYYVWPMAIISQAWTATSDAEILAALDTLVAASACTGLVHESFDQNNFNSFTRPWFAWANSLFASLVLKVADERPQLIFSS